MKQFQNQTAQDAKIMSTGKIVNVPANVLIAMHHYQKGADIPAEYFICYLTVDEHFSISYSWK